MFLSAGHSNSDPGACAFGRTEAEIAVEFRNMVSFYLMRQGVPHDLDGSGTVNVPLRETVTRARKYSKPIEFHCNASEDARASGVEALSKPDKRVLSGKICEAISNTLGIRNRGAKPDNAGQHHRLAFCEAGGIIVELFFLTNPRDLAAYDARKWLAAREVARVLASV